MTNEVSVSLLSRLAGAYQSGTKSSSAVRGGRDEGNPPATARSGPAQGPPNLALPGDIPSQQKAGATQPATLGQQELGQAVEELNDLVQSVRRELRFSIDEDSGRSMIQVIDASTDEVIRQIPPDQVLSLIQHLREFESGLFQEKA